MVLSGAMHAGNTKLLRASRFPVCSGLRRLSLMSTPPRAHVSSYSKSLPMRDVSFTGRAIDQSSAPLRIGGARGFRTSVVTAALKNGIVGLPNVGKVRNIPIECHRMCLECVDCLAF